MNKNLSGLDADEVKLKNRIALLKNEESRIMKKLEQDRQRAETIKKIQEQNDQNYIEKMWQKDQQ